MLLALYVDADLGTEQVQSLIVAAKHFDPVFCCQYHFRRWWCEVFSVFFCFFVFSAILFYFVQSRLTSVVLHFTHREVS